ncbi:Smr domain containing protein [Rhabdaerophilaceae bacterium]
MRRRRRGLSPEELALWSHVARQAKPLPGQALPDIALSPPLEDVRDAPIVPQPNPTAQRPKAGLRALPPLAPLDRRARRDVTRGARGFDGRIDLHGMRQAEAHRALLDVIHRAHHEGWKLVLVITGKGGGQDAHGEERGVLRRLVPHWLADPVMRRMVLGYEAAGLGHGGEGALYVRIRKARAPQKA